MTEREREEQFAKDMSKLIEDGIKLIGAVKLIGTLELLKMHLVQKVT